MVAADVARLEEAIADLKAVVDRIDRTLLGEEASGHVGLVARTASLQADVDELKAERIRRRWFGAGIAAGAGIAGGGVGAFIAQLLTNPPK
jgi:hypothetical protein